MNSVFNGRQPKGRQPKLRATPAANSLMILCFHLGVPNQVAWSMIRSQKIQIVLLAFQIIPKESDTVGVDDLVGDLHRSKVERLAASASLTLARAVTEVFVDLENVREGKVAAVLETSGQCPVASSSPQSGSKSALTTI